MKGFRLPKYIKYTAPLLPYIAVILGLNVFKSAWVAIGIYYFGIIIFIAFDGQTSLLKSFFHGWNLLAALACMAACGFTGVIVFLLWPIAKLERINLSDTLSEYGLSGAGCYFFVLAVLILNPVFEELFWRGYLENKSQRPAWIDAAFAGYHVLALVIVINLPVTFLAFIALCTGSWGLRFVKARLGGLAVPYLAHLAAYASIIAAVYFIIRLSNQAF